MILYFAVQFNVQTDISIALKNILSFGIDQKRNRCFCSLTCTGIKTMLSSLNDYKTSKHEPILNPFKVSIWSDNLSNKYEICIRNKKSIFFISIFKTNLLVKQSF
eukprot:TRINITY_DN7181_c0_g1_i1.p1 TRINITY_DN7181_c0_g1~~TRINITY_DN7181_c0_g1_i1.p1  ORF type:complete len:105 (-),score=9.45 TRINITY_DN7181_c0_g1_i1:294-608(-)